MFILCERPKPLSAVIHYSDARISKECHVLYYQHCYRPKRSFGQGNVFTGVCHYVKGLVGMHLGGISI